jgi:hypothetical protein
MPPPQIPVKSVTAAILNALGDLISQLFVEKNARVDGTRTLKFAGLGLLLVGPVMHNWYGLLSRIVTVGGSAGGRRGLAWGPGRGPAPCHRRRWRCRGEHLPCCLSTSQGGLAAGRRRRRPCPRPPAPALRAPAGAIARLLLDQLVFAPVFISTFIALLMKMDGASTEAIK